MKRLPRLAAFLFLPALATAISLAHAEDQWKPPGGGWGMRGVSRMFSIGRITEDDADGGTLRGGDFSYGVRDQSGECNCSVGAWISAQSGDGQRVVGVGGEFTRQLLGTQRFPFSGRTSVGLEQRRLDPHSGKAGILGLGFELGFWPARSVQFAVTLDRKFGPSSYTRNELGFAFRWARPYKRPSPLFLH